MLPGAHKIESVMQESGQQSVLAKENNAAGHLKFELQTKLLPLLAGSPESIFAEQKIRRFVSMLDPWPDWALRVATEVISVHFPRVRKDAIFVALKTLHGIFFEAEFPAKFENAPQVDLPRETDVDLFRFLAHLQKHMEVFCEKMDEFKLKSPEKWTEHEENMMSYIKNGYDEMGKTVLNLLCEEPAKNRVGKMEAIVAANNATHDEQGRIRDTTATVVYQEILNSWPQVAAFSGVKQLCEFLDPVLGHGDADAKLDRVKKIVRRMGIVFRPACQGTR